MAKYQIDNLPSPIDFQEKDRTKRILQNAKNLILCRKGEVPYDRFRGFDPAVLDLPITELRKHLMPELDKALGREPDAEVVSAEATLLPGGQVYIKVIVEIDE